MSRNGSHPHANTLTIETSLQTKYNTHKVRYISQDKHLPLNYQISVKVSDNIASILHKRGISNSPELDEISSIEKEFGIALNPVHPETSDPLLSPYFIVEVEDKSKAEHVISRLKGCSMVDAAYIKPDDE